MEAFSRVLKIDVKFSTPYHKTTQGLIERSNKRIEDLLLPYIQDYAQSWDTKLTFLTFAHNQIPNRRKGLSPASLIFGRNLRGVLDVVRESLIEGEMQEEEIKKDVISHMVDLKERLEM